MLVNKMFQRSADDFFTSMGMQPMTKDFWSKSQFLNPLESAGDFRGTGKSGSCHSSALDMYKDGDFRMEMCGDQTLETLLTAHHEMGHVQYYMNYHHQPPIFRVSRFPGFGKFAEKHSEL